MKLFHLSWNDPETVFHEVPWKKNFTVYPSLNVIYVFNESLKNINFFFLKTSSTKYCIPSHTGEMKSVMSTQTCDLRSRANSSHSLY